MNLILIGGALLGVFVFDAAPLNAAASSAILPAPTETAAATAEAPEQHGFMTHDTKVDRKTGETTEINVIGFLD